MNKNAETYATISITDLPLIDFSQIGETNETTIRKSLDESKFIIKWNTEPSFIADGSVAPLEVMTHSQALELMQTPSWSAPIDLGFVNEPAEIEL